MKTIETSITAVIKLRIKELCKNLEKFKKNNSLKYPDTVFTVSNCIITIKSRQVITKYLCTFFSRKIEKLSVMKHKNKISLPGAKELRKICPQTPKLIAKKS